MFLPWGNHLLYVNVDWRDFQQLNTQSRQGQGHHDKMARTKANTISTVGNSPKTRGTNI